MSVIKRTLAILLGMLMFTALLGGLPTKHSGQRAEAATSRTTAQQRVRAMRVALAQRGDPYRYGAAGPNAFDCSGLTKFSYGRAGRTIPRTTDQQKAGLHAVRRSHKRRGDIILFVNGGNAYHAAIYIGNGRVVHASRSGTPVKVARSGPPPTWSAGRDARTGVQDLLTVRAPVRALRGRAQICAIPTTSRQPRDAPG